MNLLSSILQVLLALHTAMGAFWKFSHPARTVPALDVIPSALWQAMGGIELVLAVGLVLPLFLKSWSVLAAIAAIGIAIEMLVFCGLHLKAGATQQGHLVYWLVVAAVCGVIAYGRLTVKGP